MSSLVRFSTPTFAAFAWAPLNLACESCLTALVRTPPLTAARRGKRATPCGRPPAAASRTEHRWTCSAVPRAHRGQLRNDIRLGRSSARKQSHSNSRCGRNSKDFAHSRDPPGGAGLSPRQKTKPEGLPEGHEPRTPIGIGSGGSRAMSTLRALFTNQNFVARCPESFLNSIGHKQSLMVAVTTPEKCQ